MKIPIYNLNGEKVKDADLDANIFWIEPNKILMHQYLLFQQYGKRYNVARTLTKWEVRWGWKKPYRQKGTGRARQWSTRNPHYIGGWVAHWPRGNQNFSIRMTKKSRKKALFSFLSYRASQDQIIWLDGGIDAPSTKQAESIIQSLPVKRNVLFVFSERDTSFFLSIKNIPNAKYIFAQYLNPEDLSNFHTICFVWDSLETVTSHFNS